MPEERLTRNQRREAAREAARIQRERQRKRDARNRILLRVGVTAGIIAVVAIVAIVIVNSVRPPGPGPANMASDGIVLVGPDMAPVETDPIPVGGEPIETDTDELGVPIDIVIYVDYLCPFCQQFDTTNSQQIEQLVTSGEASVEIRPVAILDRGSAGSRYPSRAANAAACVANFEPEAFWSVNSAFFANQPPEQTAGHTDDEIIDLVRQAGVTSDEVADCIRDETYRDWVQDATERATSNPDLYGSSGGFGTPTVLVNGEKYEGSLHDPAAFAAFVEANRD